MGDTMHTLPSHDEDGSPLWTWSLDSDVVEGPPNGMFRTYEPGRYRHLTFRLGHRPVVKVTAPLASDAEPLAFGWLLGFWWMLPLTAESVQHPRQSK